MAEIGGLTRKGRYGIIIEEVYLVYIVEYRFRENC